MNTAALMLAFASGGGIFFTLGRVFERWEYEAKFRKFRENQATRPGEWRYDYEEKAE